MKHMVWTIQAVCLLGLWSVRLREHDTTFSYSPRSARHQAGPGNNSGLTPATP